MRSNANTVDVYLEVGKKRTFAGAIEWPGWTRSGRDEGSALEALLASGPRYARALEAGKVDFQAPADASVFSVVERHEGGAGADFGVPERIPSSDTRPFDETELQRYQSLLKACWRAFDQAVKAASGKDLRKGPRGGGRDLEGVARHVLNSELSYLKQLGFKLKISEEEDLQNQFEQSRLAILDALAAAARGEAPKQGPRGGVLWPPRYFVRRSSWHVLDHAWEIEDRVE